MLDLSNNNGRVDFPRVYRAGQRRVYLKLTEGANFHDSKHAAFRSRALAAGLKVGEYHFARPSRFSAHEEADYFLRHLPELRVGRALRPCLDLEDPNLPPSRKVASWAVDFLTIVRHGCGHWPILYGSTYYLAECHFPEPPAPLWLASYGRNDGREYPFTVPRPWRRPVAHQYASTARVAGVADPVDISHVLRRRALAVRRPALLEPRK